VTKIISNTRAYLGEVILELRKANWPWESKEKGFAKYKELIDSTIIVLVAVLLLGAFVSTFDIGLSKSLEFFAKIL
jgi:preprotein translocase subunit SecE